MSLQFPNQPPEPRLGDRQSLWEFGVRLANVRRGYQAMHPNVTLEAFCSEIGEDMAVYADIEAGEAEPGLLLLVRISAVTNVKLDWLMLGTLHE